VATVLGCGQLRRDVDKSEAQGCFQAELPSQLSTDRNATRRGRETGDTRAENWRLAGGSGTRRGDGRLAGPKRATRGVGDGSS
jgi:hypothetical protein